MKAIRWLFEQVHSEDYDTPWGTVAIYRSRLKHMVFSLVHILLALALIIGVPIIFVLMLIRLLK